MERDGEEMEKRFSTGGGLEVTIFCPAGADMHGRPNQLWRARWQRSPRVTRAHLRPLTKANMAADMADLRCWLANDQNSVLISVNQH